MFENQLTRCSALGRILTNGRDKKTMGDTCKSYLQELHTEVMYGFKRNFMTKHIEKGLMAEESAIALLSEVHEDFYTKNDEHRTNKYISGTPDIVQNGIIRDIKSSWDIHTFPMYETELPKKDYFYQVQGYMWLFDCEVGYVDYVLVDTPARLLEDEKRRAAWSIGATTDISPEYLELCAEIDINHDFSRVPKNKRVKSFRIERDEKVIEAIKERVLECREYLKSL